MVSVTGIREDSRLQIRPLRLKGTFEIRPRVLSDNRGCFAETYRSDVFKENDLTTLWIQENQSLTARKGTIRGLHFQSPPFAQTKLIQVPHGRILDVFVDIRKSSPTYGEWDSIELSSEQCNAVYIPEGFAHGFCTIDADTVVQYKVDSVYSAEHEGGIRWNDDRLGISWGTERPVLSAKDEELPAFSELVTPFE